MSEKPLSSFGVEIEFLAAVIMGDDQPPKPERLKASKGRPIYVENHNVEEMLDQIRQVMQDAAEGHEGDRVLDSLSAGDRNANHLLEYRNWAAKLDVSVDMPFAIEDEKHMDNYWWYGFEITSPPLWATEKSYQEVHRVIEAVSERFLIFAPSTAGLHVHYGRGKEWIPLKDLRRIAAFLYAADPVLARLHASDRRDNIHCLSNRLYSSMAHGIPPDDVRKYLGQPQPGEPIELNAEPDLGLGAPAGERFNIGKSIFQRGILDGYHFNRNLFKQCMHRWALGLPRLLPGAERDRPLDVHLGAYTLLSCPDAPTIRFLNQTLGYPRMAYNFEHYKGIDSIDPDLKRTIEFRQPTGTVNADEVVAHAKVCVRLADYASTAPLNELWKLILDLQESEENSEWFDVFDLLAELGLEKEAEVIERQKATELGIKLDDPDIIYEIRKKPYPESMIDDLPLAVFLNRPRKEGEYIVYRTRRPTRSYPGPAASS